MNNTITERSNKAEILSAALELADSQAVKIGRLQQQQHVLAVALVLLLACSLLA